MNKCKKCNTIFKKSKENTRHAFCSRKCYKTDYDEKNRKCYSIKNCEYCKKEYETSNRRQVYCSSKCQYNSKLKPRSRNCKYCNKLFTDKAKGNRKTLCSKECIYHYSYMTRYGLTKTEYKKLKNKKKCESCGSKQNLHFDHNHETGYMRGILCRACNTALGLLKENVQTLNKLVKYLERNK